MHWEYFSWRIIFHQSKPNRNLQEVIKSPSLYRPIGQNKRTEKGDTHFTAEWHGVIWDINLLWLLCCTLFCKEHPQITECPTIIPWPQYPISALPYNIKRLCWGSVTRLLLLVLQAIFCFHRWTDRDRKIKVYCSENPFISMTCFGKVRRPGFMSDCWSLCTFFCQIFPRDGNATAVQNGRPYHVLFYVGVSSRRHLHFSVLLSSFSYSLLNHHGLGTNMCISGYQGHVPI